MIPLLGKTLNNRYLIEEHIGRGGMAEVYRAYDQQRGVYLALKVLREDLAEDKVFLRRFEREAKTLAMLQHPNIVRFYGFERSDGYVYMLMEYVEGETLRKMIAEKDIPMNEEEALAILDPICRALNYAHQMGRVHCDVKSANILIQKDGHVYLTDFGIARGMDMATSTMVGIGTPAYMAPELIKGEDPTPQTDIYALGIVLYEMLTGGERPFTGERATITGTTADKVRWEHLKLDPIPLSRYTSNIPPDLEEIVKMCLSKDLRHRFSNIAALSTSLKTVPGVPLTKAVSYARENVLKEKPVNQSNPMKLVIVGTMLILGCIFLGVVINSTGSHKSSENDEKIYSSNSSRENQQESLSGISVTQSMSSEENEDVILPTSGSSASSGLHIGSTMRSSMDGMTLLYVPAGSFEMGSENERKDESPVHTVWIDAFWIDETEVTNQMYEECVADGACEPQNNHDYTNPSTGTLHFDNLSYSDYSAVYVNWEQAENYCEWAGRRLPTEAEWEKAAKGDTTNRYPWGNSPPNSSLANFDENKGDTVKVGNYPAGASPYGALDMAGNVYEWVSDWYNENYYSNSPSSNPQGPSSGNVHVLRGGSFYSGSLYLEVTYRSSPKNSSSEEYGSGNWGFRCAMDTE